MNDRLMKLSEVTELLKLSKCMIYKLLRESEDFPRPVKLGRASRWSQVALQNYIENMADKNGER